MGVLMLFSTLSLIVLAFFLFSKSFLNKESHNKNVVPEAPGKWPIIGHLHLLVGSQPLHIIFSSMAEKYGPIFTINIGVNKALVVSNHEIAKECFTSTNDKAFASRPKSLAVETLAYNYAAFGLGPNGDYWRHMRKVSLHELLSNRRLQLLGHIRASEIKASLKGIYDQFCLKSKSSSGGVVLMDMKEWLGNLTLNVTVRMLFGKRYNPQDEEGGRIRKIVGEYLVLLGTFVVGDAIPFLRWLDLGGHEKSMRKAAKEMDDMLQRWLEEHKRKRKTCSSNILNYEKEQDFMGTMLSILDSDHSAQLLSSFDADTINKATCSGMLLGGTETTTITLTWALVLLFNNPLELKKVMAELDENVENDRQVKESDMKNLVFLQAVIKETIRLYPAGPLTFPRESIEHCFIADYYVPKGTRLFVNLHKLQRDPNVWSNPNEFQPERFLTSHKDIDVRGQDFELIPFGSGRRVCPGISFVFNLVSFTLASLLHAFEFAKPSDELIDTTEISGLTTKKVTPLEVQVTPRLSSHLYQD